MDEVAKKLNRSLKHSERLNRQFQKAMAKKNQPPATMSRTDEEALRLPEELRGSFRQLMEEYRFLATVHNKMPMVSCKIIADLIRGGWRQSAERTSDSNL